METSTSEVVESNGHALGESAAMTVQENTQPKDRTMKEWGDKYPGKMAMADVRGTYSGCTVQVFSSPEAAGLASQINTYFAENPGLLVVDVRYWSSPGASHAALTFTAQVSESYIEDLNIAQAKVDEFMTELKLKKAEELHANMTAEELRIEENKRLAQVGRQCEQNHGAVVKQLRDGRKDMVKRSKGRK